MKRANSSHIGWGTKNRTWTSGIKIHHTTIMLYPIIIAHAVREVQNNNVRTNHLISQQSTHITRPSPYRTIFIAYSSSGDNKSVLSGATS